jgi:hypothetical protein
MQKSGFHLILKDKSRCSATSKCSETIEYNPFNSTGAASQQAPLLWLCAQAFRVSKQPLHFVRKAS